MNKERFFDLLTRNDKLTEREKEQLNELLNYHIPIDEISDYVLYLNNETPENTTILRKIPLIEKHLRKCHNCNDIFLDFNNEHAEIASFMDSNYSAVKFSEKQQSFVRKENRTLRYLSVSVLAVIILFFGTFLSSYFLTPQSYKLADIDNSSLYITRGRTTNDFDQGLKALENNNYDEAVTSFKKDISKYGNDRTVFYTCYILGLTYLQSAEKNFAGIFKSYDSDKVTEGIHYLQEAIAKNNSGEFPNLNYDSEFYLGKAYLMLNDKDKASGYFREVIASKGSKMDEAKKILSELK